MTHSKKTLALVMISNFGRADGGRETWAYQFLPRLLQRDPDLSIDLHGLRVEGQADTSGELLNTFARSDRRRLHLFFHRVRRNAVPNSLKMIWAMRRWRKQPPGPDLALGVGSFVELLCMLLAPALRGSAKAIWLRTIYIDEKARRIPAWARPAAKWLETAVLRRADLIIANGDDTAAHYRARGFTVTVIKNAVDLERWQMNPPRLERPIDVAFVGRLVEVKGGYEFLELCSRLTRNVGQRAFRFHVVGEGEGEILSAVKTLAAAGRLNLHGTVPNDDIPSTLAGMDVCVALTFVRQGGAEKSGGSGVSNALLEQMAAGRVCICWDNAAFRQVLDDDSAYFVEQGTVDALEAVMIEISENPEEARRRAANAASLAERYGIDGHMSQFGAATRAWLDLAP
jgi:glycosyltransferase involved in cell wall biosynthesis